MNQTLAPKTGDEPNPIDTTGLCLLSLDGGGVRGLSTLYILKGLMQRLNYERQKEGLEIVKPCDVFDLIGGTSTGGLIAIMLGRLEMTVDACITAYEELMKSVFEDKSSWLPVDWLGRTKPQFDSGKLRKAIEKVVTDNGASTGDLFDDGKERGCRVFVCTTAHETTGITRLRSYTLPGKRNIPATICEAALATSAATGFFDPVYIGVRKFEDGALGANNPSEEVEREAADIWCSESRRLQPLVKCFVSIGTGNPGKKAIEDNMLKFLSKTLVKLVTETERTEAIMIERWAPHFSAKRFFRLNVDQGLQDVGLAEYKEQGKIEAATEEYLEHTQQVVSVRNCVVNLKEKQNFTSSIFEATINEFTIRMIQLQSKSPVFCNIPFAQNERFVGRGEQLEQLRSGFFNTRKRRKIAITGLGGIGKTQVALQFAYQIRDEAPDCSIFWIPAISREGLEQTYTTIVQALQIPGWEDKKADSKALLQRHLSQKSAGRWLLIFDNADDIDMWLGKDGQQQSLVDQLPRSDDGCILFTTRDRKTAVKLAHQDVISVADPDEEMAIQLLRGYLSRKELVDDVHTAVKLLNELAFLPLAIVQAAAYLNENDTTLAKYLGLLVEQEEDVVDLLSKDFEDESRYHGIKNPVAATWLISFEQMCEREPLAGDYLSFMACIEPTNIPQSMLPAGKSRMQETDAIGLLKAYSFVGEKSVKMTSDMHRLVHLATRSWLRKGNRLMEWTIKAKQQLSKVFPDHDYTNRSKWTLYLPHARRILESEVRDGEEGGGAHMQLLWKFAMCLHADGKFNEAEDAFAQVMEMEKKVLGEEHPGTLASISNLALTYINQGRWKEAEELGVRVIETRKRVLGKEHPGTLISISNLAITFWNQGRWKEAEELDMQVIETRKRVLGKDHPNTLTSMNNLAWTWKSCGREMDALKLITECLELHRRILGDSHPNTVKCSKTVMAWTAELARK
ncbi:FabD/lysophospholipase-like protein [Amniculicola lignicola CBS 123094]|uniref:FabD/lysophospholipase-like protein n=1 Tax=Amniculicola lignicola CBS 123094 TaxID=1392246 RepID=A0A6A5WS49_9PLEO|nr:FabD/lysophospholipase-like protein [Amniculicola lignicola CBS 123094]